jgi:hypothetical protein
MAAAGETLPVVSEHFGGLSVRRALHQRYVVKFI